MEQRDHTDIVLAILAGTFLFFLLGVFIVTFLALFQRKRQQHRTEKERLQSEFESTLLQSQLEIKEQTMQQIGYDLHDGIGQLASLIKINLFTLDLQDPILAREKIEYTKDLMRELIGELKMMALSLNTDRIISQGFVKSLETEVGRLNKTGQFSATLSANIVHPIEPNKAIILFRMTQELINNIVKHSHAKNVSITFNEDETAFTLLVADDGIGFNTKEKLNEGGSGLLNLQNRGRLVQAVLGISSSPGQGTLVSIQIAK